MSLDTILNNLSTTLGAPYVAASGTLTLAAGYGATIAARLAAEGQPAIGSGNPLRLTVASSNTAYLVFKATAVSGDVLTGTVVEGVDQNFASGATVEGRWTSGLARQFAAGNSLPSDTGHANQALKANGAGSPYWEFPSPTWLSLKTDVGIPDDCTVAPTTFGSPTFSDAAYGTLNLASGPHSGSTVTQAIQSALDNAANGPLAVRWDVRCSVGVAGSPGSVLSSALLFRRPGNLLVRGTPGSSVTLRAQTNQSIFANDQPTFGTYVSGSGNVNTITSVGGIQFSNLVLRGLTLNVNSGLGHAGTGGPAANQFNPSLGTNYFLNGIRLFGVQDVWLDGCQIFGAGGFHTFWGNWQRIRVTGGRIDALGSNLTGGGNDCLHLNGPGNDAYISECRLACQDDHVAINTADGYSLGVSPNWGSITNVRGHHLYALGTNGGPAGNFVRVQICPGLPVTGHVFDGLYGTVGGSGGGVALLTNGNAGSGSGGSFEFRNVDTVGTGTIQVVVPIDRLHVYNFQRKNNLNVGGTANPGVLVQNNITNLDVDTYFAYDDGTNGAAKPQIQVQSPAVVSRLRVRDAALVSLDASATTMPLVQVDAGATVTVLDLDSVGSTKVQSVVTNAGTIVTSLARGVTQSGGGTGVVSNSGTWTNSVLSNTDPATTDFTGTAPGGTKKGDYYTVTTPTFAVSPLHIPSGHAGNITLTLAGSGTSWANGTTVFTPSGVANVTKVSQTVTASNAATVVLTTGAGTGTLTVTESVTGSASATTTVAAATLAVSPNTATPGSTPTLTMTGTNTVWLQETPAGLFTESGGTGASIGTPTVTSNTTATAVLTAGSASATETITDTSVGTTASVTVAPGATHFFSDNFAGTGGTVLDSHAPAPIQNGSDLWAVFPTLGNLALTGSGGCQATGSAAAWAEFMPLTGVTGPIIATCAIKYVAGTISELDIQIRRNNSNGSCLSVKAQRAANQISVTKDPTGSSASNIGTAAFTWVTGTTYVITLSYHPSDGSVTCAVDGVTKITATAADAAFTTQTGLLLIQNNGAAGDGVFVSVAVDSN